MIFLKITLLSLFLFGGEQKGIKIQGNMPVDMATEFNSTDTSKERQKEIAQLGYIDAIELYCRQRLFGTYGVLGDLSIIPIRNSIVEDVLELLIAGSKVNANCQFMYACVLSGNKTIRGTDDNYEEYIIPEDDDYKYLNLEKSKEYFVRYLKNPDEKKAPFGYSPDWVNEMINNAFPELLNNDVK